MSDQQFDGVVGCYPTKFFQQRCSIFFFFENNGVLSLQTTLEIRQMQVGDGASSSLSEKVISPFFLRWLPQWFQK